MLKLIALDEDDLAVVSAHLQDAVMLVGDMAYLPRERRFAALLNRFDWVGEGHGSSGSRRARTGLRIERVVKAELTGIDRSRKSDVLSLLAIEFATGPEPPGGIITLQFSAGAGIRLHVECIEAQISDTGSAWSARARPGHPDEPTEAS